MGKQSDPRDYQPLSPAPPRTPFQMNRSATTPVPRPRMAPPSPDLPPNMGCAFPPFPRSATPQSAKTPRRDRLDPSPREKYAEPSPLFAPLSPRINGGENITKRMDKIAPGPFDGRIDRRPSAASVSQLPVQEATVSSHRRTNTQSSTKSFASIAKQRTSVSSSTSRTSSYSTRSIGLPARPKPGMNANNAMPPPPPPPASQQSEGIDAFLDRLQKESQTPTTSRLNESTTDLSREDSLDRKNPPPRPRRPSEKDLLPIDTAELHLPQVDNTIPLRNASRGPSAPSPKFDNGQVRSLHPPALMPQFRNDTPLNPLHTPSDSGHSDDSYASSGFHSVASSRSSPPGSEPSHSRQASKVGRTGYLDETLQRTTSPDSYLDAQVTPPRSEKGRGPGSFTRLNASESASQSFAPDPTVPESPMDPAIQPGVLFDRRPAQSLPRQDSAFEQGRAPSRRLQGTDPRRQDSRPPSKGKCRGCSEPIIGKSVKDSSGRLTGRYHKQCFVCRTCSDPFPTAEFYVFDNSPYCERHYHELNGSLCTSCDRGIEGQYLETDNRQKFHPRCFSCTTCRIVLRDDYFEVGGKKYCDRHAQHAAAPPQNYLGPGGYRPRMEKRRTRLMMMA